jgi:stage II sporulation protein D
VRLSSLKSGKALLILSALLSGCQDNGPAASLGAPALAPSFDVSGEDAGPDSGEVVVFGRLEPTGPADWDADGGVHGLAVTTLPARIRIGVVQSADIVTLGSSGDYTIHDKVTGLPLMTGVNGSVAVSLLAAPPSHYRLQVVCGSVGAVSTRKAAAETAGYPTFTEFVPAANCTRLFIGEFAPPPVNNFSARNAFRNKLIAEGHAGGDSFWKVVAFGTTIYRLTRGAVQEPSINPVVVTSGTGVVRVNGASYRGKGEAQVNGAGTLAGINELPIEQYLYGVVPRELGPIAFPEVEAQKAQAVAARTFAVAGLGRRGSDGYDLRATTDDQVYGGHSAEHRVSSAAVDATAGIVITHGAKLITALYHSTSGGHTADSEEAFSGTPAAYLRGVPDAQRGRALDHVPTLAVFRAHANPRSLRAAREGDFESDWASLHRWTFEWTMAEISTVISAIPGHAVGKVTAINVLERGPSGRVLKIEYVTDAGTFSSTKDQIRASLRFINASGNPANLPSTLFFIEPIEEHKTGEIVGYRAYGGGFGHGVGLSQTGAVGMAEKGRVYDEILRHYYRGIELVTWY